MSVENRLRPGRLEANARAFVPEGEQRLLEVRRRYRARTGALAAAVVVVGFASGRGCRRALRSVLVARPAATRTSSARASEPEQLDGRDWAGACRR